MDYEQFKKIIELLEKVRDRSSSMYELGVDLLDYDESFQTVIMILIKNIFQEEGYDWISWYLYERMGFNGRILQAWDENENEICQNVESLWDTVKPYIINR